MFDIHIFTLYSLNQTILKKVEKKGKGKGRGSHGHRRHPARCTDNMGNRLQSMLEDRNTGDAQRSSHAGFCFRFIFNFLPVP